MADKIIIVIMLLMLSFTLAFGNGKYIAESLSKSKCDDVIKDPFLFGSSYHGQMFNDRKRPQILLEAFISGLRSDERRVGQGWCGTWGSGGSPV